MPSFEQIYMQWDWGRLATGDSNKQERGNSPWRPRGETEQVQQRTHAQQEGSRERERVGGSGALQNEACSCSRSVGQGLAAWFSAEDCSGVGLAEQDTEGLAVFA